ncbi:bifunctional DNA primase/polymerase [Methylosinus sp. H3A]|uniref:bifunctional DNA primase/polymerase n=1 Tax=Methylosinus sp. H3A TaxID=2785786 RepID=UPI0018C31C74|nr:bifunctional DNA primase/polymerase [Methylosinus sp. H3A]MBG0811872.1 bifunctional DNA primase/polymerase [Methylosinus sp. H3A]
MSSLGKECGRAEGIGAPAQDSEKTVEFDFDANHDGKAEGSRTPSFQDANCLDAHAAAGHPLIPLSGKKPIEPRWTTTAKPMELAKAKERMRAGGNVGVRLRATDLVVDVDPRYFHDGDDPFERLKADFALPDAPFVTTGGGGWHHYFRKPAELAVVNDLKEYKGIEFKSKGRQVVAAGSIHPTTGEPYRLEDDPIAMSLSEAPEAPGGLLDAIRKSSEETSSAEAGEIEPERLAEWLKHIDVGEYRDESKWRELMMACHHATAGEGVDEFVAWSTSDPPFHDHEEIIRRRWRSLESKSKGITIKTLIAALPKDRRREAVEAVGRVPPEQDFPDKPEAGEEPTRDLIDRMNERFCVVLHGGKFAVFMEDEDGVLNPPRRVWTKMSRADFVHYHEDERVRAIGRSRELSVAEVWLASPRRRKYPGIVMDPEGRHGDRLNLWRGWAVEPRPGDWSLMRELIEDVLCSGDRASSDFVVRWIAFMLQKPGVPAEVAITFRGTEGTGKGTLGRALMAIAGAHGLTVSSPAQFAGRFNAHLRSVAFLFADEAFWPGHKEAEGVLKQLVTEPFIAYEAKGADIAPGRNLVHLMMASNNEWVVPAGLDARRFAVFDVSDGRRGDEAFFRELNVQLQNGGLAAMAHSLLSMKLGDWHPARHVPRTQALADQKALSLDPASKWWMGLLDQGMLPTAGPLDWEAGAVALDSVAKAELLDDFDRFLKANRIFSAKATHKGLVAAGRSLGLETGRTGGGRERPWSLPALAEARRLFAERLGASDLFA